MIDVAPLWAAVEAGMTDEAALWREERIAGRPPRNPRVTGAQPTGAQLHVPRLPKQPMRPRLHDPRVRFLKAGKYARRWRLEKADPAAKVSDAV